MEILEHGAEEVTHGDDAEEALLVDHGQVAHLRLGPFAASTLSLHASASGCR